MIITIIKLHNLFNHNFNFEIHNNIVISINIMKTIQVTLIVLILTITSCSTYNGQIKKEISPISSKNITAIEGTYLCNPLKQFYSHYSKLYNAPSNSQQHILDKMLMNQPFTFKPLNALDSLEIQRNITVKIVLNLEDKTLIISDYHNYKEQYSASIPFTIKKGFIHLDNKNIKKKGVPFIYHTVEKSKVRIALSPSGNLIAQKYSESTGNIFIFAAGSSSSMSFEFKRITN